MTFRKAGSPSASRSARSTAKRRWDVPSDLEDRIRLDALLFGETQCRIVVTASQAGAKKVLALAKKRGVKAAVIGRTGGSDIVVEAGRRERLRIPVLKAFEAWKKAIPAHYAVKA